MPHCARARMALGIALDGFMDERQVIAERIQYESAGLKSGQRDLRPLP